MFQLWYGADIAVTFVWSNEPTYDIDGLKLLNEPLLVVTCLYKSLLKNANSSYGKNPVKLPSLPSPERYNLSLKRREVWFANPD